MRRVLHFIRPYLIFVITGLLCAVVSVVTQLLVPIFCGDAIDAMIGAGRVDFASVVRIVLAIAVATGITAAAQWVLSVCNNRIIFGVSRDLRNAAIGKIQTLPLSYLDVHPSGDLVSRIIADVDTFADGLLMGFTQLFTGVLTILGTLGFMISVNLPITLVVVCLTPLSLFAASFIARHTYRHFQGQTVVRGEQTAFVNEMIEGQKVILAKPQTYMNLSGESVRSLLDYYKVDEEQELLVIYDDISLGGGQIRIRAKGSAGGHNGIKNIIAHLGGQVFPRIKVGVGEKPPKWDLADYVLGHFSKEEQEQMEEGYEHAVCAVKEIVTGNIEAAMNEYNRKKKEK